MLLRFNRQLKRKKHSYRQTKVRVEKVKTSTTISTIAPCTTGEWQQHTLKIWPYIKITESIQWVHH